MRKELHQILLFGTGRKKLSDDLLQALEQQGFDLSNPPEQLLLDGLATYELFRKAAIRLEEHPESKSIEVPDLSNERRCSPRSARHLQKILNGDFAKALDEFIHYLRVGKYSLPPEVLPELLDQAVADETFWESIKHAIGPRGEWLLQQHPEWKTLGQSLNEEDWELGTLKQRVRFLKKLRHQKPEDVIPLLEAVWSFEGSKEKKELLSTLAFGLSANDEIFLEKCLDDRHKDTRLAAAKLLARLPASNLRKRIREYLEEWLVVQNNILQLQLPEQINKSIKRDGIQEGPKRMIKQEKKELWLSQAVGLIPLEYWEERLDMKPANALQWLTRNHSLFLNALVDAILLHKNKEWATALAEYWLKNNNPQQWKGSKNKQILFLLPNKAFNSICTRYFKSHPYPLHQEHFIAHLLSLGKHRWEDELTRLFVRNMQEWIENVSSYYFEDQPYLGIIKVAAYHVNPHLFSTLQNGWYYKSRAMIRWEKRIEQFLNTLIFRKEMIQYLR